MSRSANIGLKYVPLDKETVRLALFTDTSFANADNYKSQIGFVLVLTDASGNANIIHYGSSRCKRVTRSVMAAEVHALIYGFDNAYLARDILQEILEKEINIDGYVEYKTVFNVIAKSGSTLEKRLQIDVFAMCESHARGELRYPAWIPGTQNIADGLTRRLIGENRPLWNLMKTNKISITAEGWVEGTRFNRDMTV